MGNRGGPNGSTVRYGLAFVSGVAMIGGGATLAAMGRADSALVWAGAALTVVGTLGDRLTSFSIGAQGVQGQLDPPTVVQHTLDSIKAETLAAQGQPGSSAPLPVVATLPPGAIADIASLTGRGQIGQPSGAPEDGTAIPVLPPPSADDGEHRSADDASRLPVVAEPAAIAVPPAAALPPAMPPAAGRPPAVAVPHAPPAYAPATPGGSADGSGSATGGVGPQLGSPSYWSEEVTQKAMAAAATTDPQEFARRLTELVAAARQPGSLVLPHKGGTGPSHRSGG